MPQIKQTGSLMHKCDSNLRKEKKQRCFKINHSFNLAVSSPLPQSAEELFVMANEAKILLSNERVASAYCRIYYELDLSNSHAIVLLA